MRRIGVVVLLLCVLAARASAGSLFDPAFRFRTLPSEHFVIYFHQGEDRQAARLSAIAEETWRVLARPFAITPPRLTRVVLVDQTESSNGYATPFPRDTIVIYAVWPAGSDALKTDDWLRLVFTHEFTHIVHLDRSEGWARAVRGVFGRLPLAFPNTFLPTWQIEGLATYEESAITGEGRMDAGDFRAIVNEAARARRLEPIDRVNGGLTDWPGGTGAYAYGLGFHAYLADRFGANTFAALAEHTARSIPYLGSLAFQRVYGRSLGTLWREYEAFLLKSTAADTSAPGAAERLTHHGFVVTGPRFAPPRCGTCAQEIQYSARNADEFPAMYRLVLSNSAPGVSSPERLTTRYLGSTLGINRDTTYFDQQDVRRNTSVYSDLYARDRATGHVRTLTAGARLVDPDVSPDGQVLVAAQDRPGQRDLVLVRLHANAPSVAGADITVLATATETQFNAPRWSPDGSSIVAERHRPGAGTEIVVVDVGTHALRVIAASDSARWATPTWRPDGLAVVAAADFDNESFNLYEISLTRTMRRLTHTTGGATWPDVAPDGKTIIYVGYTADGYDVFRMAYPSPDATDDTLRPSLTDDLTEFGSVANAAPALPYSPWSTLPPTSWSPIAELTSEQTRIGAAVTGADVLGYHAYALSATWAISQPKNAPAIRAASPDWQASYAYARWWPTFYVSASRATSFFAGPPSDTDAPSTGSLRERIVEMGVLLPVTHIRFAQAAQISILRTLDDFTFVDGVLPLDRSSARLAWSASSAHLYGNSISLERGVSVGVTAELVRPALGASADATTTTADARVYLPGFGQHQVLALRVAGGTSSGDPNLRRAFLLGGAGPNASLTNFGSDAFSLLRGFGADTFGGSHAALVNADYRMPLAKIERGVGTWPIFLHTIHAAIFMDAGQAWTRTFAARSFQTSLGAELSADIVAGYWLPLTTTVGAAWGHDGRHQLADRVTVYVRIGKAF